MVGIRGNAEVTVDRQWSRIEQDGAARREQTIAVGTGGRGIGRKATEAEEDGGGDDVSSGVASLTEAKSISNNLCIMDLLKHVIGRGERRFIKPTKFCFRSLCITRLQERVYITIHVGSPCQPHTCQIQWFSIRRR